MHVYNVTTVTSIISEEEGLGYMRDGDVIKRC